MGIKAVTDAGGHGESAIPRGKPHLPKPHFRRTLWQPPRPPPVADPYQPGS